MSSREVNAVVKTSSTSIGDIARGDFPDCWGKTSCFDGSQMHPRARPTISRVRLLQLFRKLIRQITLKFKEVQGEVMHHPGTRQNHVMKNKSEGDELFIRVSLAP